MREWLLAITPVISAFAAIVAIFVGAWVQRRNLNATLRQKRAEDFRAAACQFIASIQTQRNLEQHTDPSEIKRRQELRDELPSNAYQLRILLDPNDRLQKQLRDMLQPLQNEVDKQKFEELRDEALRLAHLISDEEYKKARRGS